MSTASMEGAPAYGVHSEVGRLRKVLVCAPGLAHRRLTPSNCDSLLFDDVLWVQNAQRDHLDFMAKMKERGFEVLELHDLLAAVERFHVEPILAIHHQAGRTRHFHCRDLFIGGAHLGVSFQINFWLWLTVLFANFAEAVAEGRGKAQAATLRRARTETMAKRVRDTHGVAFDNIPAPELVQGDIVLVEAGDLIPSDGEVIEGVA